MWIILEIRRGVKYLYQAFGDMALWCWAHDPPFGWLGDRFLDVYDVLTDLHYGLYLFDQEYEDLWERVLDIITESDIFRMLQTWLNYAEDAWDWVLYAFSNVIAIVDVWWGSIIPTIQGWIDIATEGFAELRVAWDNFWEITFPNWTTELLRIGSELSDFFTITLPGLLTFDWLGIWWNDRLSDIDSLINSTVQAWFPFYDDLVELWNSIVEFFTDPLTWLEKKFTDWFLGEE